MLEAAVVGLGGLVPHLSGHLRQLSILHVLLDAPPTL
jgi:hypothetical protein